MNSVKNVSSNFIKHFNEMFILQVMMIFNYFEILDQ